MKRGMLGTGSWVSLMGLAIVASWSSVCLGGDIVNGWSDAAVIQQVRSFATYTEFQLLVPQAGCGTPDSGSWWRMPLEATEANRYRRAMLLAAFTAGQSVQLRCESSQVTDFFVSK